MEPSVKAFGPLGIGSFHVDGKHGSVAMVFKGVQMFAADVDGFQMGKGRLDVFNGNAPVFDSRPPAPFNPPAFYTEMMKNQSRILATNKCLPWASREKLCPSSEFESKFLAFRNSCGHLLSLSKESFAKCKKAFSDIFPCFNTFLRSSKKCGRGMGGWDISTACHFLAEAPWDQIKNFAQFNPLDNEFKMDLL